MIGEDDKLIEEAGKVTLERFGPEVRFERAVFLSWYCSTPDCTFCFMSLIKDKIPQPSEARRRWESVLAEIAISKALGWPIGFLSAGTKAYGASRLAKLCELSTGIMGEKPTINVGALSRKELERIAPHISGVCAAVETVDWKLREEICPTKPMPPYLEMFDHARELGLSCSMTLIIGLGETRENYPELEKLIREESIEKIVIYGIVPHEGSPFQIPCDPNEQAWWITKLRLDFPDLHITAGIWYDRPDSLTLMLRAGANAFSKFQAFKYYGTDAARDIQLAVEKAGRKLVSTLAGEPGIALAEGGLRTLPPKTEGIDNELYIQKGNRYLKRMKKNQLETGISEIHS